jgi:hypothetical protein
MAATKKLTANFFQEDLVGRRSILVSCIIFFTGVFKRAERQPTVLECFYEKKVCLEMLWWWSVACMMIASNKDDPSFSLPVYLLNSTIEVDFT